MSLPADPPPASHTLSESERGHAVSAFLLPTLQQAQDKACLLPPWLTGKTTMEAEGLGSSAVPADF